MKYLRHDKQEPEDYEPDNTSQWYKDLKMIIGWIRINQLRELKMKLLGEEYHEDEVVEMKRSLTRR